MVITLSDSQLTSPKRLTINTESPQKLPANDGSAQLRFLQKTHKMPLPVDLLSLGHTAIEDQGAGSAWSTHTSHLSSLEEEAGKSYIGGQPLTHSDTISGQVKTGLTVVPHL